MKDGGQCNTLSRSTMFYCINRRPHEGDHVDCQGRVIHDGYIQNYARGPRGAPHIYFGKAADAMLAERDKP